MPPGSSTLVPREPADRCEGVLCKGSECDACCKTGDCCQGPGEAPDITTARTSGADEATNEAVGKGMKLWLPPVPSRMYPCTGGTKEDWREPP